MKKNLLLAAILAGVIGVAAPASVAQADVAVSFSFFHDNLAPYGQWVNVGSYGRCWYPVGVPAGWQPYTVGHWGYGDYGWTWASYDPWGDVTYRYGTWTFAPPYGWVWVPGYTWAPAWVTWSYTNDYIGWAPIPPSFSFSVAGYFGSPVIVNRSWYCFVPTRRFASVNVVNVRVPVHENQVLLARSQNVTRFPVSNGVVRNSGLELRHVERASATRVQRVSSRDIRTAPARIESARMSGRRVAVAEPASSRSVEPARSARAPRNEFRGSPSKPTKSHTSGKSVQSDKPDKSDKSDKSKSSSLSDWPEPRQEANRAPESRSETPHRSEMSGPSAPKVKNRPSASSSSRSPKPAKPSKASQPHESRANTASDLPEFRSKTKVSSNAGDLPEFRSKTKSQAKPPSHHPEGERGRS